MSMPHCLPACSHGNLGPWLIQACAKPFKFAFSLIQGWVGWRWGGPPSGVGFLNNGSGFLKKCVLKLRNLGFDRSDDVPGLYELDDFFDVRIQDAILFEMGNMKADKFMGGGSAFTRR